MTEHDKLVERATRMPESISETNDETLERQHAHQLYLQAGAGALSGIGAYQAGWKAAKARYENR